MMSIFDWTEDQPYIGKPEGDEEELKDNHEQKVNILIWRAVKILKLLLNLQDV